MNEVGLLLLRADASPSIGAGHVMRCLALAQAWRRAGGQFLFLSRALPSALERRIREEGGDVVAIQSANDAQETAAYTKSVRAQAVVLDGYELTTEHHRACRDAGATTVVIDDTGEHRTYACDLILNQNLHADERYYADREAYCELLLGVRYTLLREEFLRERPEVTEVPAIASRVLLSFGGADLGGLSQRAIDVLDAEDGEYTLLIGAAHPNRAHFEQCATRNSSFRVLVNSGEVAHWMRWSHVAVVAAGSTVWELAFMGVPSLVIPTADNQLGVAESAHRAGFARSLGHERNLSGATLKNALAALRLDHRTRQRMSENGRATVDGTGANNVVSRIIHARGNLR